MRGHYQRFGERQERSAEIEPRRLDLPDVAERRGEARAPRALHDADVVRPASTSHVMPVARRS